jgi:enoyl-CoA hydratase
VVTRNSLTIREDRSVVYLESLDPVQLGAESDRLAWQLVDACTAIREREDALVGVAIVGSGGAFCVQPPRSGADCDAAGEAWPEATAAVAGLAPPTIAVVAGDAFGPAFELALACDLRIAAEGARLGAPEIGWGRIPSAGGTQRLVRAVGRGVALRMLLLRDQVAAADALSIGLVHRAVPAGQTRMALEEVLDTLRAAAPIALTFTKEAIQDGSELPLRSGLVLEADLAALLQITSDRAEGIRAFKERRTPHFEGR